MSNQTALNENVNVNCYQSNNIFVNIDNIPKVQNKNANYGSNKINLTKINFLSSNNFGNN